MSGTPTIKGNSTIIWGTDGLYGTGTVIKVSKTRSAEIKKIKDNKGFTQSKVFYDHATMYDVECLVETSVPDLEMGDVATVDGVASCIVEDHKVNWEQEGEAKWTMTVASHDALTLA